MIKAILIDDEPQIRQYIKNKLLEYFSEDITIVAEADGVASGLEIIAEFKPQLIFLDIHLLDGTGFDLLDKTTSKEFDVIFVTAFDEHAIKAIRVGALDYILKPIDDQELKNAVNKAIIGKEKENHLEKLIEVSSEYFRGAKKKRVILKTLDMVYAIYEDDIIYCRSDGNYTMFYTQQLEKIMVSKTIKKVEELLSEDVFVRCHQSYIVNKQHVLKYSTQGVLIVYQNDKIPVSARRKGYTMKRIFD